MLMDLEVNVRSRCTSGISHQRNGLSTPHALSRPHNVAFVMSVESNQAIAVVEHHRIPIAVGPMPAIHYHPIIRCHNRCPPLARDIDTPMEPSTSHAKT